MWRLCPECSRILAPAEVPRPGDMSECLHCKTVLVFDEELMLRLATLPEIRRYRFDLQCAEPA